MPSLSRAIVVRIWRQAKHPLFVSGQFRDKHSLLPGFSPRAVSKLCMHSCHLVTGSSFVQVTLDTSDSLSMRHPHKFMAQQALVGHAHGMSSGIMSGMMPNMPASDDHHDDAGSSEHQHDADTLAHNDLSFAVTRRQLFH
jgi:hypothetical protein